MALENMLGIQNSGTRLIFSKWKAMRGKSVISAAIRDAAARYYQNALLYPLTPIWKVLLSSSKSEGLGSKNRAITRLKIARQAGISNTRNAVRYPATSFPITPPSERPLT
jgi:hypothetical protein